MIKAKNYISYVSHTRLLLTFLFLFVFSCSEEKSGQDHYEHQAKALEPVEFDLDQIRERGSLVAILNNSSTGYFIYRGQPMGYEYELLTRLASELGLRLQIKLTSDIDEAVQMLNEGEGDIIAFNMAVTSGRQEQVAFTEHHNEVKQVLVQRKPENWLAMKRHEIDDILIRNPLDIDGKTIHVQRNSAFVTRLENLSEEIGGKIEIVQAEVGQDTEGLIQKVAEGEIDYTVADEDVAMVNATYYSNIDVSTPISFPQKIAWATRSNATQLLNTVNNWIMQMKKQTDYYVIYNKYYKSPKASLRRVKSSYSSLSSDKISPFDDIFKQAADSLGWDWRLLAAQAFQESKFDITAESWAGAIGLMQLLPETGELYGISDMHDPLQSLQAGTAYLSWLDDIWTKYIPDSDERIKFVLASYNAGQGHVLDARRLAQKFGKNPSNWDDVAYFLERKSEPEFYNDPVVESGYCRGSEPVNYVEDIMSRYERYKQLVNPEVIMASAEASI
ncbi:membrane-bound lytic murein transglycosylase F [Catalinimonas alkaloidigena]|uniref:transporter substrate-binding domain-containing protein n=1 Tax=Catalinimonas alkaloidigena TaxID=1075417 RepID=UPI0024056EDB|nr:transporter substrate-binding domain-containing protein [Catalinimonas alkaloidigena]MDF9800617.1 membrane-bound lytic murein transglycosylase F [Catalinimonas alkaloidigena]